MEFSKRAVGALMLACAVVSISSLGSLPNAYAPSTGNQYSLVAVPSTAQEGTTVSLVLSVNIMVISTGSTQYSFIFVVKDPPPGGTFQSQMINHTSPLGETHFSVVANYTSSEFPGVNSLAGTYSATVDQIAPSPIANVAGPTTFVLSSIDNPSYERTQTVNVQASGYNSSETVGVTIKTLTIPTIVFSQSATASGTGVVTTSWKIPVNATIDNYIAFLNGTTTHKNPPDNQTFAVRAAILTVSGINSAKTTYQRTETMKFSFQPIYPDLTTASTGLGLLTLTGPNAKKVTLTATYDSTTQTFNATYTTSATNQTGTWTASLAAHGYSDAVNPSNSGPASPVSTSAQLNLATLSVTVSTNTNLTVGQQLRLNVTVAYPDGSHPASATIRAYLVYSGTPAINDTVPLVYDSGLGFWVGTHTTSASDTGGLWSLIVSASDSASPANTGTATRAITIQNTSSPTSAASFPLYFFGIIAAIIAGLLLAVLLLFRRRRVGHTSLKIDLDAVHSEAGRIENQEFFKTIKEQVRKDLDDKS